MCLFPKHRRPKIALKNITVYKNLSQDWRGDWVTPFIKMRITSPVIKPIEKNIFLAYLDDFVFGRHKVEENYIHAYKNRAVDCFEAIIPAGSIYYEDDSCYAASTVILKEFPEELHS